MARIGRRHARGSRASRVGRAVAGLAVVAVAGVGVGAVVLLPGIAQAATGAVRGAGSGLCIDVHDFDTADGAQLNLWDCNGGANQQLTYTSGGQLKVLGKCLDASAYGRTGGTRVIVWACTGGANQRWTVHGDGTVTGVDSGLCLDAAGAGTTNGTLLQLWPCNGGSNQTWSGLRGSGPGGATPPPTTGTTAPSSSATAPPTTGTTTAPSSSATPPPTTGTTTTPPSRSTTTPPITPPTTGTTTTAPPGSGGVAPSTTFAVGTRLIDFKRGSRDLATKIYYPATGAGSNSPIAPGRFPLVLFSHGWGGNYNTYVNVIEPLARAGFVVAAPNYPHTSTGTDGIISEAFDGTQSLDASAVITGVLALNTTSGDPLDGHLDTSRGVGAAGHSLGGYTTAGLLGLKRDTRITTFIVIAGGTVGAPSGPAAKVLFIQGDADPTVPYSSGRALYAAIPSSWSKAFLTQVGQGHDSYVWSNGKTYPQTWKTMQDWFRWGLYGDAAARNRLTADAADGDATKWEAQL